MLKHYIGLMSGTSLDGVDGVLMSSDGETLLMGAFFYVPFDAALRADLLTLQAPSNDEIHHEAVTANRLAHLYAICVTHLLDAAGLSADNIALIGVHGQTIRHRPEHGYTRQANNPALLAELTGIDVVADFRSRDIAAGGQGAPLVPAYHQAMFSKPGEQRVVLNIGGIANISVLNGQVEGSSGMTAVKGFDTGPGNVLMDMWNQRHHSTPYDTDGSWAAGGTVIAALLSAFRSDPFFALLPPKSTGRDLFNPAWLDSHLKNFPDALSVDVQATLTALTATTIADAIGIHAPGARCIYACGGGAYNSHLMESIVKSLKSTKSPAQLMSTETLGMSPTHVEACAFAWLARCFDRRECGNLPDVTGAKGPRILGALYPAT